MGCDIHSRVEVYRSADDYSEEQPPKRWYIVDEPLFVYPYFDEKRPLSLHNLDRTSSPLLQRNYRLFAILADVRNGRGFAGSDMGDRLEPIDDPRGVPLDASPEWLEYVESWGSDLHSTSWFTLAELDAVDYDRIAFDRGYVDELQYRALRGTERAPESYSGGIWGGGIVTFTAVEYEAMSDAALLALRDEGKTIYVQHQWAQPYRAYCDELFTAMETMRASAPRDFDPATRTFGPPQTEHIRIVFGFDN